MEFRIPLRRQYSLDFATSINGDPYFYGAKFVEYPDGSFHLHAELIADTVVESANNPLNRRIVLPLCFLPITTFLVL
jgi:hypothetical protein